VAPDVGRAGATTDPTDNQEAATNGAKNRSDQANRARVKLDKFAPWQIKREFHLSSSEWIVLLRMAMFADWESHELETTYDELHADVGGGSKTVPKAVEALEHKGCIEVLSPFGPNVRGIVRVLVWDWLIVPEQRTRRRRFASPDANDDRATPVPIASQSRRNHVVTASHDANAAGVISADANTRGTEAMRDEEALSVVHEQCTTTQEINLGVSPSHDAVCRSCGEQADLDNEGFCWLCERF
jgi:hypothetical protein